MERCLQLMNIDSNELQTFKYYTLTVFSAIVLAFYWFAD